MLDLDAIRKRAEVLYEAVKNEYCYSGDYIDEEKSPPFIFYSILIEALDELERTRAAALELRELLEPEEYLFAFDPDKDDFRNKRITEALVKTKWLEEVANVRDFRTVQTEGSRSAQLKAHNRQLMEARGDDH